MGLNIAFHDAKKIYTNPVQLKDFPRIDSNGVIWHYIDEQDKALLTQFSVGDLVTIRIDIERRSKLSISHTASHLLYMAIDECRPNVVEHIFGCHIKTDGARFDFYADKFTENDIKNIESICNQLLREQHPIQNKLHEENNDAKYWSCKGVVIPCGGTHIDNTRVIKTMRVKRKGLGSGKERVMCTFESDVDEQIRLMETYTRQPS